MSVSATFEPSFYHQVVPHAHWRKAMNEELLAIEKNNTWSIVCLHIGKYCIGCKWVYKVKHKAGGSVERYKAGLVVKGYKSSLPLLS